jgi:hypothetical protein
MNPRIFELQEVIRKAQIEISSIQTKCPHEKWSVVRFFWRPGAWYPTRFCSECQSQIPGITEEEKQVVYEEDKQFLDAGSSFSLN